MSFANELKRQLLHQRYDDVRLLRARTHGLLRFSKAFGAQKMLLQTENKEVAELYADSIFGLIGLEATISVNEYKNKNGKSFFCATVDDQDDREKILRFFGYDQSPAPVMNLEQVQSEEELGAFVAGAFVACGSMVDPRKSYHLEFVVPDQELCMGLVRILSTIRVEPKNFPRRGNFVAYLKDSGEIEDLLGFMGAGELSLEIMNVKIYKSIRNQVNRVQNCEFANMEKTINASSVQVEEIEYILNHKGLVFLPEDLREIAELRAENPEMSLRELGEALSQPLTRSGVNHRLKRLSGIYNQLMEQQKGDRPAREESEKK
ncbi:MAG: DNA-binding protein WhiA [Oscillospiraceae bacterium]|nr:DNA-binding protein WhiA [Oscillospiraceae bacterium]